MSVTLVLTLLAATVSLAAVGWGAALLAERLKVDAVMRGRLWLIALLAPLALIPALPLGWAAHALAPPAPVTVYAPETPVPVAQPTPAAIPAVQPAPMETRPPYAAILLALLVAGGTAKLGLLSLRWFRAARLRAAALRLEAPILESQLQAQAARLGVPAPALRPWDGTQSVLVGLRRPAILLPRRLTTELGELQLGLILAHELGHLRARDPWRMALAELAGALMWFNPFSQLSLAALAQAREEICDAVVLKGADRPTRKVYAETLMAALREQAGASPALAFTGAKRRAVRRMTAILRPGPASPRRAALCAGVGAVALSGSLGGLAFAAGGMLPTPVRASAEPQAPSLALVGPAMAAAGHSSGGIASSPAGATADVSPLLRADSARATAELASAASAAQWAEDDAARARRLYATGTLTIPELLAAENKLQAGRADLARAQAATAQIDLSLAKAGAASPGQLAALTQAATEARAASQLAEQRRAQSGLAAAQANLATATANYDLGAATRSDVEQARSELLRSQAAFSEFRTAPVPLVPSGPPVQTAMAQAEPSQVTVSPPSPSVVYTQADWLTQPTAAQTLEVYPSRAREAGTGGNATMRCQVDTQGRVSGCAITAESPPGLQFGAAALRLQQYFRMRPKLQNGEPVAGTVTIPLRFSPPPSEVAQATPELNRIKLTPRPPAVFTSPRLLTQPTGEQLARVYPARAGSDGIGGVAILACLTDVQGKVYGCRVTKETPAREGFGAAALRLQRYFTATPMLQNGQPIAGNMTIHISFQPPATS